MRFLARAHQHPYHPHAAQHALYDEIPRNRCRRGSYNDLLPCIPLSAESRSLSLRLPYLTRTLTNPKSQISQHFYEPWKTRADMEACSKKFQTFKACLAQICLNSSNFYTFQLVAYTSILLFEAYYITSDGGMKGPWPFIFFRVVTVIIVTGLLYNSTVALATITLKV